MRKPNIARQFYVTDKIGKYLLKKTYIKVHQRQITEVVRKFRIK